jgi:dephospho-CoA kinase
MKVYGLTGGIGMGKSTSEQLLRKRGFALIDTDFIAKQIVEPGRPALRKIVEIFGQGMLGTDGRLRRDELAKLVFEDANALQQLESILHPEIREIWLKQIDEYRNEGKRSVVVVIPLLFETNAAPHFDAVVCVACSAATQRQRLLQRGWSAEHFEKRIRAQWPVEKKMSLADYVIWTEGTVDVHAEQLARIFPMT